MVARPNHPVEKVRELQRRLYIAAKRNEERLFHAMYDRIWRSDVLLEAGKRVRSNKGAAGIDCVTLEMIEQRPLGIPTVRDRVVQMAAKIVIEPIFEADFQSFSYGFRPRRTMHRCQAASG